jgi:hypothetical protein
MRGTISASKYFYSRAADLLEQHCLRPAPAPSTPARRWELIRGVAVAIDPGDGGAHWEAEACAAILAIADWLELQEWPNAARLLRREAGL